MNIQRYGDKDARSGHTSINNEPASFPKKAVIYKPSEAQGISRGCGNDAYSFE
jgi:hypothetical protein